MKFLITSLYICLLCIIMYIVYKSIYNFPLTSKIIIISSISIIMILLLLLLL